jgi:LmbE family N-acetylglucosaminyl deacetylase
MSTLGGVGTAEQCWRAWPELGRRPTLALPDAHRVLVVAPHPDDEVLALGGLLATYPDCHLIAVTDGEGSHPHSEVLSPQQLAAARRREQHVALARLGRADLPVTRLGHRDGRVRTDLLARQLSAMLRPGDVCLATWRRDGHPDHEAVGQAAHWAACEKRARLWEYPVWTWHWAVPGDPRVPWARARSLGLDPAVAAAKAWAVRAFRTQVEPLGPAEADAAILPAHVLAHFERDHEIVFTDEATDAGGLW